MFRALPPFGSDPRGVAESRLFYLHQLLVMQHQKWRIFLYQRKQAVQQPLRTETQVITTLTFNTSS